MGTGIVLDLAAEEHAQLGALAGRLADSPPGLIDDADWVRTARALSVAVPERVRAAIREFRHDPGPDGFLLIQNLPLDPEQLPPTPTVPESVQRRATQAAAVQALLTLQLGELVAFRDEKAGALVQNVVPVPGREKMQGNAGSTLLQMHAENAFHLHRPDYVALMCLRNDHDDSAGLRVSCVRRAVGLLNPLARKLLAQDKFITEAPSSFTGLDGVAPAHAVLTGDPEDPDVRVDFTSTHPLDDEARVALNQLKDAFDAVSHTIVLRSGQLAVVDNRVTIHGRTAFQPRYDGMDRWLHRTFAHLDHRRSRALRAGNGNVLV
jgi:L-asparagine oxygenase